MGSKKTSKNIAYYLDRIHTFLISDAKSEEFPSPTMAIEDIMVQIVKDRKFLKQWRFDDGCNSVASQIAAILEKNSKIFTLSFAFQINVEGSRVMVFKKIPVAIFKEPVPLKPLRKPHTIQPTLKSNEPSAGSAMSSFKTKCLNATLNFVKNDALHQLLYPDITTEQATFIMHMIEQCKTCTHNTAPLGFKGLYDPLAEAMKIFGLKYEFQLVDDTPANCDLKRFKFEKIPKAIWMRQDVDLDKSFSSTSTDSASCEKLQKLHPLIHIIRNLDENFKDNAIIKIKDFLTYDKDGLEFSNVKVSEEQFLLSWKIVCNVPDIIKMFDLDGQMTLDEIRVLEVRARGTFRVTVTMRKTAQETRNVYFSKKLAKKKLNAQNAIKLVCTKSNQIPVNSVPIAKPQTDNASDLNKDMPVNSTSVAEVDTNYTTDLNKTMPVNSTAIANVGTDETIKLKKNMPVKAPPTIKVKTVAELNKIAIDSISLSDTSTDSSTETKKLRNIQPLIQSINTVGTSFTTTAIVLLRDFLLDEGKTSLVFSNVSSEKLYFLIHWRTVAYRLGIIRMFELKAQMSLDQIRDALDRASGKFKVLVTSEDLVSHSSVKFMKIRCEKKNKTPKKAKKSTPVNVTPIANVKTGLTEDFNVTPIANVKTGLTEDFNVTPIANVKTGLTEDFNVTPIANVKTGLTEDFNVTPIANVKTGLTEDFNVTPIANVKTGLTEDFDSISDTSFSSSSTDSEGCELSQNLPPLSPTRAGVPCIPILIYNIRKLDENFKKNAIIKIKEFLLNVKSRLKFSNVKASEELFLRRWETVMNNPEVIKMFDLEEQMVLDEIRMLEGHARETFRVVTSAQKISDKSRNVYFKKEWSNVSKRKSVNTITNEFTNNMPVNTISEDSTSLSSSCSSGPEKTSNQRKKNRSYIKKAKSLSNAWVVTALSQIKRFILDKAEASMVFHKIKQSQMDFLTQWWTLNIPEVLEAFEPDAQAIAKDIELLVARNVSKFSMCCNKKKVGLSIDAEFTKNPPFSWNQPNTQGTSSGSEKSKPKCDVNKVKTPKTKNTKLRSLRIEEKSLANVNASKSVANVNASKSVANVNASKSVANVNASKSVANVNASKSVANVNASKSVANVNASKSVANVNASKSVANVNASKSVANVNASKSDANVNAPKNVDTVKAPKNAATVKAPKNDTSNNNLVRAKAKLMEGLNQPVVSEMGLRMMRNMGWEGGALGLRGDGIVEPIKLPLDLAKRAGLGSVKPPTKQATYSVMSSLPVNITRVVIPHPPPKPELQTGLLQTILKMLVENSPATELNFPMKLTTKNWSFVRHITKTFNIGAKIMFDSRSLNELCEDILDIMRKSDYIITACWGVSKKNVLFVLSTSVYEPTALACKDWRDVTTVKQSDNQTIKPTASAHVLTCDGAPRESVAVDGEPFRYYVLSRVLAFCQESNVSIDKVPSRGRIKKDVLLKGMMAPKQMSFIKDLVNRLNNKSRSSSDSEIERSLFDESITEIQGFTLDVEFPLPKFRDENTPPVYKIIRLHKVLDASKPAPSTQNKTGKAGKMDMISTESTNKLSKNKSGITANDFVQSLDSYIENIAKKVKEIMKEQSAEEKVSSKHETAEARNTVETDTDSVIICTAKDETTEVPNNRQNKNTDKKTDDTVVADCICCLPDYDDEDSRNEEIAIMNVKKEIIDEEMKTINEESVNNIIIKKESFDISNPAAKNDRQVVTETNSLENYKVIVTESDRTKNDELKVNNGVKIVNDKQIVTENVKEENVHINVDESEDQDLLNLKNLNLKDSFVSVDNQIKPENLLNEFSEQTSSDLLLAALKRTHIQDTNEGTQQKEIESSNENLEQNGTRIKRDWGKRMRSNAQTPDRQHKKRKYTHFYKKICFTPSDYPQTKMDSKMASKIQKSILESIDYTQDLPLLKCYGIQDGALTYSCHSENSLQLLENVVNCNDFQVTVEQERDQIRHKMAIRINTFIDESVDTIFERLETFNMSLNTKDWSVIKKEWCSDYVVIFVEMDDSSYMFIRSEKYSLYAGIDEAKFSVIWS